jgi:TonB family protein
MARVSFLKFTASLRSCVLIFLFLSALHAQRLAIVTPEKSQLSEQFASSLVDRSRGRIKIIDSAMAEAAFRALEIETPFNMTVGDSRRAAAAVGCDFLVLIKAVTTRRSSLSKGDYHESFAVTYFLSERSGRLADWSLTSFEADTAAKAEQLLLDWVPQSADRIVAKAISTKDTELNEKAAPAIEQLPLENTTENKDFRPPIPYKRLKPDYTRTAFLYGIRAVVEVEADIEADGRVSRTEIARWAGYGLEESVIDAVRKMNWRPAERGGKPLPMRVLLRYNFTKIEKE